MNGDDWAGVEILGPPPAGNWFAAGRWECKNGHVEIGGVTVGVGVHTNCTMCGNPLTRVHVAWVEAG